MTLDPGAGYRALRETAGAVWLERDLVRVVGPDAETFLQGQLSQDIDTLGDSGSVWSLVLAPQGKVDALVRVSRIMVDNEAGFVLDTDAGWGEALCARLNRFKLRVKVGIDALDWRCLALVGPDVAARAPIGGVVGGSWPSLGGVWVLGAELSVPDDIADAGLEAWEVARIEAGLPMMGAELTERTIPAEVTTMIECAVSFSKGCFTGQELVARIDSRGGHVPRNLRGLLIDGPPPSPGTPLEVDGKEIGTVTSAVPHPAGHAVALAYVRREVEVPGEALLGGGGVARIQALPLVS